MTNDEGPNLGGVCAYFPSLDGLLGEFRRLAQDFPERAALFVYGQSRQGERLWGLRLGSGPRRVLAYAFPQPDEPLGGLVLLRLARRALEDDRARQATWVLLPCVDPDGARRNEAWFTRPLDLAAYARNAFRPAEGEQVEWSCESRDPAWPWERVLPETQALQTLLDDFPELLFPLHNALLGGAYAFLSPELAGLAAVLPSCWERRGLPTHRGEPELPFAAVLGAGVYALPTLAEMAAALSAQGLPDPAGLLRCGAPAYAYARRRRLVHVAVPELPLFAVRGIGDAAPAGCSRREVLGETLAADRAALRRWQAWYGAVDALLEADNPYRGALAAHHRSTGPLLEATARWLAGDPALERPATVAEVVDARQIAPYLRLLPLGMLVQALASEEARGRLPPWARQLLAEMQAALEQSLAEALTALDAAPVAPDVLAEVAEDMLWTVYDAVMAGY